MVFKTPSYWCWIDSHSVDISSVLYWGWSPGVTHSSHALYSQPRTFAFIHFHLMRQQGHLWASKKLKTRSFQYFTFDNWVVNRISHLSSFCKAAQGMVPPQISALLFSELYNGLMHGHVTLLNIQVEEDMWVSVPQGMSICQLFCDSMGVERDWYRLRGSHKRRTSPFSSLPHPQRLLSGD